MNRIRLQLTDKNWSYGSYKRKDYNTAMLYTFHQYKKFDANYNMTSGRLTVEDGTADRVIRYEPIKEAAKKAYVDCMMYKFQAMDGLDNLPVEALYTDIMKERRRYFGAEALEKAQTLAKEEGCSFDIKDGVDQSSLKARWLSRCEAVIMVITDAELYSMMEQDIYAWKKEKKEIYLLVSSERGYDLPSLSLLKEWTGHMEGLHYLTIDESERYMDWSKISGDQTLQQLIDEDKACLYFYGCDGFILCRNLALDSMVHGIPSDYFAKAMTNQHGMERGMIVCAPRHFDIVEHVKMTERTRISYWQLARLEQTYGEEIYRCSPKELYLKYPQFFLNIYANGSECIESRAGYPIQIHWPEGSGQEDTDRTMRHFDMLKAKAVHEYLNGQDQITYFATYFNENMEEVQIPWYETGQQKGILVHAARIKNASDSYVRMLGGGETIRELLKEKPEVEGYPFRIYSNFLFFLTPRLAQFYNDLRADRPREQVFFDQGHLDYMLHYEDGERIETYPLFRKACIAMMDNGQFLFFNHSLGGGSVFLKSCGDDKEKKVETISWSAEDVNIMEDNSLYENKDVIVYNPMCCEPMDRSEVVKYRKLVGEGRVNFVISQNNICCIRKGSVVLSPLGVVVSMKEQEGLALIDRLGLEEVEDGYYLCHGMTVNARLDKPEEISEEQWNHVKWVYGGGLSLILNGEGLCDGDNMNQWLLEEGWMSPMSMQTQESSIEELVKHPRTAVGIGKNGDLIILVYSGRIKLSTGADYKEMIQIARALFPDVASLMNVDGGGSSMMGLCLGKNFMELSSPATSHESCTGMTRPINTILCAR